MKTGLAAVLACTALTPSVVLAQPDTAPVDPSRLVVSQDQTGPYAPRAGAVVYAVGVPAQTGGVFAGSAMNVYDDVTFGITAGPVTLRTIEIGLVMPTVFPPTNTLNYLRVTFFPTHNPAAPSTAAPYSGTPVVWVVGGNGVCAATLGGVCAQVSFSGVPITLDSSNVFTTPGDVSCGILIEPFQDAALTIRSTEWQIVRRAGFSSYLIGSSDTFGWFSGSTAGVITNADRSGGGALGTGGNVRATYMTLYTAIPCDPDFNADGDSGTDADIEAFFACLAGVCCRSCASADFNGDGDAGTDADIESFFRALAGGGC